MRLLDSPAPSSPVVTDEAVQVYKNTIEEQSTQIKSLESKVSELESTIQTLVSWHDLCVFVSVQ